MKSSKIKKASALLCIIGLCSFSETWSYTTQKKQHIEKKEIEKLIVTSQHGQEHHDFSHTDKKPIYLNPKMTDSEAIKTLTSIPAK